MNKELKNNSIQLPKNIIIIHKSNNNNNNEKYKVFSVVTISVIHEQTYNKHHDLMTCYLVIIWYVVSCTYMLVP